MNGLQRWIIELGHPPVAPLIGYPGARLTETTLRQNLSDAETQTQSILAAHKRWPADIVLPMMDLSVEAGALGLSVRFPDDESPTVEEHPIRQASDLDRFRNIDILTNPRLQSFLRTLSNLSDLSDTALCAYVVGPFTLAGLLMGASEIAMATIRNRDLVHQVVAFAARVVEVYAVECIAAGAVGVIILEPTATLLSPAAFEEFSGQHVAGLAERLAGISVLHVCGQTTALLDAMCDTGVDGLSLDAPVNFPGIIDHVPSSVIMIGNVDPVHVMGTDDTGEVQTEVERLRAGMAGHRNFILSTGCDLPLETPPENIDTFLITARQVNHPADDESDQHCEETT